MQRLVSEFQTLDAMVIASRRLGWRWRQDVSHSETPTRWSQRALSNDPTIVAARNVIQA